VAADLTVGGKNFTEQLIIAEMTKQLLESKGHTVDKKDGMGTKIVRAALEGGEVDLYWEYTGTSLITFNKITEKLSPEETYERVKQLDGEKDLVWLAPSKRTTPMRWRSVRITRKPRECRRSRIWRPPTTTTNS
jgi:osmoprotectant transport system substrate-binding protein